MQLCRYDAKPMLASEIELRILTVPHPDSKRLVIIHVTQKPLPDCDCLRTIRFFAVFDISPSDGVILHRTLNIALAKICICELLAQ